MRESELERAEKREHECEERMEREGKQIERERTVGNKDEGVRPRGGGSQRRPRVTVGGRRRSWRQRRGRRWGGDQI